MVGRYLSTLRDFDKKPHHSQVGLYETVWDRPRPPHREEKGCDGS